MIPSRWRNWTIHLGLAWACLIFVGCGGSDIPDPEADSAGPIAAEAAPPVEPPAPQVADAPKAEEPAAPAEKAAEPAVAANPTPPPPAVAANPTPPPPAVAAEPKVAAAAEPKAAAAANQAANEAPTTPPAATPDAQPKPDAGATTAEMLALSAGNSPNTPPPPAGAAPGGAPAAGPNGNAPAAAGPRPGGRDDLAPARPNDDAPTRGGAMARRGGGKDDFDNPGGGRNREDGFGRSARDTSKPVNFYNPHESVKAFLDALEDRDVDRLSEATALRAQYEASPKNQELFKKIKEVSISEAVLNDIAEKLDGYTISGEAPVKSTGRLGILISKTTDTGRHQRTITVRKEKDGWKVLDISTIIDFKTNAPRRGRSSSGRN